MPKMSSGQLEILIYGSWVSGKQRQVEGIKVFQCIKKGRVQLGRKSKLSKVYSEGTK